eukprot:SAG22_NODE_7203_length_762_cov_1.622926_2_plen_110_part_00
MMARGRRQKRCVTSHHAQGDSFCSSRESYFTKSFQAKREELRSVCGCWMAGCLCVAATVTCCERKLAAINQLKVDNTQVAAIVCVLVRRNSLLVLPQRTVRASSVMAWS